eukprot:4612299-Pleurochrysis_carterae.AAC.3
MGKGKRGGSQALTRDMGPARRRCGTARMLGARKQTRARLYAHTQRFARAACRTAEAVAVASRRSRCWPSRRRRSSRRRRVRLDCARAWRRLRRRSRRRRLRSLRARRRRDRQASCEARLESDGRAGKRNRTCGRAGMEETDARANEVQGVEKSSEGSVERGWRWVFSRAYARVVPRRHCWNVDTDLHVWRQRYSAGVSGNSKDVHLKMEIRDRSFRIVLHMFFERLPFLVNSIPKRNLMCFFTLVLPDISAIEHRQIVGCRRVCEIESAAATARRTIRRAR